LLYSKDEVGKTPLHWAVGKGQPAMAAFLIDTYRIDPNIRNNNGGTPLNVAASQQSRNARVS
jgi:ankyrin repeat protein